MKTRIVNNLPNKPKYTPLPGDFFTTDGAPERVCLAIRPNAALVGDAWIPNTIPHLLLADGYVIRFTTPLPEFVKLSLVSVDGDGTIVFAREPSA